MRRLNLQKKLTLIVGFVSTVVVSVAIAFIVQFVFYATENQIKKDLEMHFEDIKILATPEKSNELAKYLRSNDLSLLIYDKNGEIIAKYGIYRSLSSDMLKDYINLPRYTDKVVGNFGEYDIYSRDNIQISVKNNILPTLKKSFYISILLLMPVVWIISSLTALYASNIILSPLLKAANISHELKTPLARVASTLQVILDSAPSHLKSAIKSSSDELISLGGNVDSLLSLSLFDEKKDTENKYSNLKRELNKQLSFLPKNIKVTTKINNNLVIPVGVSYLNIIVRNLLENASKYNVDNGFIDIVADRNGSKWQLVIKNSTATKQFSKGYGLGMTIVEDICHKHNISIKISSVSNIFVVRLEGRL